jgi:6-phosphogluconate dehydrogenase
MTHADMAAVFRSWNGTELASYLIDITATILATEDTLASGPLVEVILDKAGQKGTGRWSSETALKLGIPAVTIAEAVFARSMASLKEERLAAAALLAGPDKSRRLDSDDRQIEALRQALLAGFIVTYAQGFELLEAGGRQHGWPVDLAAVARAWRGGCIIRAGLLDDMAQALEGDAPPRNLMGAPVFAGLLGKAQEGWRQMLALAIRQGVPVPAASSSLAYYDGYRSPRLWASLIQAQRDYFGAHGYERTDRDGMFHTDWLARE